jgi:hypothetical protein
MMDLGEDIPDASFGLSDFFDNNRRCMGGEARLYMADEPGLRGVACYSIPRSAV